MLKSHLLGLAAVLAVAASPALAQKLPAATMLVADVDRVVAESTAGVAAAQQLQTRSNTLRQRLQTLQTQLQTEAQAIQTGQANNSLAGPALEARVKAFQGRQQAAQQELEKGQEDIQRAQNYVSQQIGQALQPILATMLRERGASLIVPASAVLQHSAGLDATADLLARLNAALPSVSTTPPAAPAAPAAPR
ncbi:OmpH family outer membrane protein [Polymorphobacter sp.]|uniref:OmpH family outer membrane protein n=1 Tax=Polymorphobacter sp. TaxID=1909290 RepID=UPI003F729852